MNRQLRNLFSERIVLVRNAKDGDYHHIMLPPRSSIELPDEGTLMLGISGFPNKEPDTPPFPSHYVISFPIDFGNNIKLISAAGEVTEVPEVPVRGCSKCMFIIDASKPITPTPPPSDQPTPPTPLPTPMAPLWYLTIECKKTLINGSGNVTLGDDDQDDFCTL